MTLPSSQMPAIIKRAKEDLGRLVSMSNSPFLMRPPRGFMRGIDFYRASELLGVMAAALQRYNTAHGHFPDLINPQGFNAWVVRRKFLDHFRVPQSGNKLLTKNFIPPGLKGVRCAKVLWHSHAPKLPPNEAIAPGTYFLKSNHGSGMNKIITYPLSGETRAALEAKTASWLKSPFGLRSGEWWYSAFRHQIILEEYLGDDRLSFNFFCFRGSVALVVLYDHNTSETITMTPELKLIHHKNKRRELSEVMDRELLGKMLAAAKAIALPYDFVRVDFFCTDSGEIVLGEMTFTPGNGQSKRPEGIDEYLGERWREVVSG